MAAVNHEIGNLLSPSQVTTFTDCQARWFFRHVVKLPDPKNANLALGIAVHEAIAWFLKHRIAGTTLTPTDAAAQFTHAFHEQLTGDTILRDEDDPKQLQATGRALVSRYVAEVAPRIRPALISSIEEQVEGTIAGVRVQGKIDIREEDGTLRDIKTACRKPSGIAAAHAFQLATYMQIAPQASANAVVDTLVKTKEPQIVSHPIRIDAQAIRQTRVMYPLVQEAMRGEVYVPNRASNLCSRNNCPFWRACEREFGGRVSS